MLPSPFAARGMTDGLAERRCPGHKNHNGIHSKPRAACVHNQDIVHSSVLGAERWASWYLRTLLTGFPPTFPNGHKPFSDGAQDHLGGFNWEPLSPLTKTAAGRLGSGGH